MDDAPQARANPSSSTHVAAHVVPPMESFELRDDSATGEARTRPAQSPCSQPASEPLALAIRRALIVEDNPADIARLRLMLDRCFDGLEVVPVQMLDDAVQRLDREDFDVVLLDLGLPDARGLSVVIEVNSHARGTPILVLTGHDDDLLGFRTLRAGAQEFLPKRLLDPLLLERAIRHAVERASLRSELQREHDRSRRLAQRVAKADRLAAIGRIAAGIAHEINNPATYVASNLEYLSRAIGGMTEDETTAELRRSVEEATEGFGRITAIVRDLQSFTRTDDDQIVNLDLNDAVHTACRMLGGRLRTGVVVDRALATDLPRVTTHAGRLTQVAINLITNALDAMLGSDCTEPRLEIETNHDAKVVRMIVRDNGCGIARLDRDRIFEAFFTTKGKRGTGLGLSLCREIVEAHHGTLTVHGRRGAGTRVVVEIPRRNGLTPTLEFPAIQASTWLRNIRALVVDDEPLIRRSLQRLLESFGRVAVAEDGIEALEMLRSEGPFDVVLCDLSMPGADGQWLYQALSQHAPEYLSRLVFLTGGIFEQRLTHFVEEHDLVVLAKPVGRAELVRAIERVVPPPEHRS